MLLEGGDTCYQVCTSVMPSLFARLQNVDFVKSNRTVCYYWKGHWN